MLTKTVAACPVCSAKEAAPVASFPELVFSACSFCGTVYRSHEDPGLFEERYDEEYFTGDDSARYDSRFEHRVRKSGSEILLALEMAGETRGRVLDVGCSTGYVLEAARRLGFDATGIDVSDFAVEECRKKGYDAHKADIAATGIPDGTCCVATLKHVLEHTPTPADSLKEMARVLSPGGAIVIAVPSAGYWKARRRPQSYKWYHPRHAGTQHHVYFTRGSLKSLLEKTGFGDVKFGAARFLSGAVRSRRRGLLSESVRFAGSGLGAALLGLMPGLAKNIIAVAKRMP